MRLEFSLQILEIHLNTKFREDPSSGSPDVSGGRTDRYEEGTSHFQQFFESALKIDGVCHVASLQQCF